jgi:hypothetical protein
MRTNGGRALDTGRYFAVTEKVTYFLAYTNMSAIMKLLKFRSGQQKVVIQLEYAPESDPPGLSISPDHRHLLVTRWSAGMAI